MSADLADELHVLLVEDNPGDARLIRHHLRSDTSTVFDTPAVTHVESLPAAIDRLEDDPFDLVLLDLGLSESRGIETLERLNERIAESDAVEPLPVVVLTGLTDDETALRAIQQGAQDYLLKDHLDGTLLERAIRYALERHRQERTLKRQNERLERFASIVSHDLRNPLNVAQGRISHERDQRLESGGETEHLDETARALDRMEELVDDLLSLAREGERVDEFVSVDIEDVIASAWQNVEAGESEVRADVTGTVTADPGRLLQLFENLFRNCVEHGSTSSRASPGDAGQQVAAATGVTITVGRCADGVFVADDGPGIAEGERASVFEAGYSTREEGTGFGLDIVQEIVDAHGWAIEITESESGGARFDITGMDLGGDD